MSIHSQTRNQALAQVHPRINDLVNSPVASLANSPVASQANSQAASQANSPASSQTLSHKNACLDRVQKSVAECTLCPLAATRNNIVFGAGNKNADVMLCGEAPGKNEDEGGLPFVGTAGKRLDALLEVAGLEREDIFIANVVKCRPPKNRDPRPEEIKACSPFLAAQIEAIKPRILVTLGTFSSQYVLNTKKPITELRGNFFGQPLFFSKHSKDTFSAQPSRETFNHSSSTGSEQEKEEEAKSAHDEKFPTISNAQNICGETGNVVTVFPVFHPAAAIYDPKKQTILENDFKTLRTWLKEHQ